MQWRAQRGFLLHAQGPEYVAAFYNVMPRCLKQALQTGDDKTKDKVRKRCDPLEPASSAWETAVSVARVGDAKRQMPTATLTRALATMVLHMMLAVQGIC